MSDADVKMIGVRSKLKKHRKSLREMIEIDFGLLDELHRVHCLTSSQLKEINEKETTLKRTNCLLSFIYRLSPKKYDMFLEALKKCNQQHIVNFIEYDGGLFSL